MKLVAYREKIPFLSQKTGPVYHKKILVPINKYTLGQVEQASLWTLKGFWIKEDQQHRGFLKQEEIQMGKFQSSNPIKQ